MIRLQAKASLAVSLLSGAALFPPDLPLPSFVGTAHAACTDAAPASGTVVNCTAPGADTTGVRAAAGSSAVSINVGTGAEVTVTRATSPIALGVGDDSRIVNQGAVSLTGGGGSGGNRGAGLLGLGNGNTLTNAGTITTTGAYNDGMAANGSNNTLINDGTITTNSPNAYGMSAAWGQTNVGQTGNTLINNGTVTVNGSNARAISILGSNGTVINTGSLTGTGTSGSVVYMQGNNAQLTNSGLIQANGLNTEAVFSNTLSPSFTARIENLAGGRIISLQSDALRTLNGITTIVNAGLIRSDAGVALNGGTSATSTINVILQTGSQIIGAMNGGFGHNQVRLEGSGLVDNAFTRFQTLTMAGTDWTWAGTGDFADTFITSGTLRLKRDLTGNVSVAAGTTLMAGDGANPSISPYAGGPAVTVTNAGTIDLTNGGAGAANSLTIVGSYVGNDGRLNLRTVLGGDGSASDKLVISGGTASGHTTIGITNLGGAGALTTADGIMVVQAVNGASTASGAFTLSGPVAAGAYEYFLFHGGVGAGTTQNWYLRSSIAPRPMVPPGEPEPPAPEPAPGTPPLPPPPPPGSEPILLYRPEVPLQSAVPPVALQMGLAALGTFHERQGDQAILTGRGLTPGMWGRVYGQQLGQTWQGAVSPSFTGTIAGLQTGFDLYGIEHDNGHRDRFGLFAGYTRSDGRVRGYALGFQNATTGRLGLDAYSLGAYWTHLGPTNWYVDSVVMMTWLDGRPVSDRGIGADISGRLFTASLEAGYPIALGAGLTLEPQAQIIWQHLSLDRTHDAFSTISFGAGSSFTGRIGARLASQVDAAGIRWQPYLKINLWHDFNRTETVRFDGDPIATTFGGTALEVGGGVVARITAAASLYAAADYTTGLGSGRHAVRGRLGLRFNW
ncbi:Outer membrane protein IcsA autotransporter precursor [bacterium YEK0313]|nr:Outer membrane protein IcsA autotransporter precursor [bacterium YEK0313]